MPPFISLLHVGFMVICAKRHNFTTLLTSSVQEYKSSPCSERISHCERGEDRHGLPSTEDHLSSDSEGRSAQTTGLQLLLSLDLCDVFYC